METAIPNRSCSQSDTDRTAGHLMLVVDQLEQAFMPGVSTLQAISVALGVALSGDGQLLELSELALKGNMLVVEGDADVIVWSTNPASLAAELCRSVGDRITLAQWNRYVPGVPYHAPCGIP